MMSESEFVQHKMETERPDLLDLVESSNFDVWMDFRKAARDEFRRFIQIAALPGGCSLIFAVNLTVRLMDLGFIVEPSRRNWTAPIPNRNWH